MVEIESRELAKSIPGSSCYPVGQDAPVTVRGIFLAAALVQSVYVFLPGRWRNWFAGVDHAGLNPITVIAFLKGDATRRLNDFGKFCYTSMQEFTPLRCGNSRRKLALLTVDRRVEWAR